MKASLSYNTVFLLRRYAPWSARGNSRKWNQADNPARIRCGGHPVAFAPLILSGSGTQQRYTTESKMKKSQKALNLKIYVIRYAGEERP